MENISSYLLLFIFYFSGVVVFIWLNRKLNQIHKIINHRQNEVVESETEILTRGQFLKQSSEFIASLPDDSRVALLFIDLDGFRNINYTLGPNNGDKLLNNVADRILRDTKEKQAIVSHLGSDEFALLIRLQSINVEEATKFTQNILNSLSRPYRVAEKEVVISATAGICIYPDCANDAEDLFKNADTAKQSAKVSGKNTYSFYTADMSKQAYERTVLGSELHHALAKNQLKLYYQPQVSIKTKSIIGAEALLRWDHPRMGFVSPTIFIPIAEDTGLIHDIGEWVINTACKDIRNIQQLGLPDLQVGINLSPQQFNKEDVAATIARAIWDFNLNPHCIEIELTESDIMHQPDKSLLMLRVLKSMGVGIAIDDFGTGYSSLSNLRNFPIDTLKIDRSFVSNIHHEIDKKSIIDLIIALAKQLKLRVIAEGVEYQEEIEVLDSAGCDVLQGFYYGRPMPYKEFCEYVKQL